MFLNKKPKELSKEIIGTPTTSDNTLDPVLIFIDKAKISVTFDRS